jgi:predicted secreted hydrolase
VNLPRRALLLAGLGHGLNRPAQAAPQVQRPLRFPQDHGSHADFKTEWWYVTGYLQADGAREFGFQVTFFRSRVDGTQGMTSQFAAKQLLFAHAGLTDVAGGSLRHDQRIAREGFGLASAETADTALQLGDWSLRRSGSRYQAVVPGSGFHLNLAFATTQPVLLQGDQGWSRKGPQAQQASFYYSQPQLATTGVITAGGQRWPVRGTAWLDHEWSQTMLHPDAVGWDWIGINLLDGSALTAFQLRHKSGVALWDGGSFRTASGQHFGFSRGEVVFSRQRSWKSPASQASYPVHWLVRTPADIYTVKAVVDNQELDSRRSTGTVYWEGLCNVYDSNARHVGRGYLEMTGYAAALRL